MIKNIIYYLFLLAVLSGCSNDNEERVITTGSDTIVYGDSRCDSSIGGGKVYAQILKFDRQCKGGYSLFELKKINGDYNIIIIALGHNDANKNRSVDKYGEHLGGLINSVSSRVICILPEWSAKTDVTLFRESMVDVCPETVDTGVIPNASDGVHFDSYNHKQMAEAIKNYLSGGA